MTIILHDFNIIRPHYEVSQEICLEWLSNAHAYVKTHHEHSVHLKSFEDNLISMRRYVEKFCCAPDKISKRGSEIPDFLHHNFSDMQIYTLEKSASGLPLQEKMKFYSLVTLKIFEEFYKNILNPPKNLIHVTCTGYTSPSAAQILVSGKNWGELCCVTNAFHMGCYAAIPGLRMAQGFLNADENIPLNKKSEQKVDLVHTELCTLHMNPGIHNAEQFVIQSLFADGFIKYSATHKNNYLSHSNNKNSFEVLVLDEIIYPECSDAMTWTLSDFGFSMTISRNVPSIISENIKIFLEKMFHKVQLSYEQEKENLIFAIHPGGPKIIEFIADILKLDESKIQFSNEVLKQYGNMSSATLPHIWELISNTPVTKNALIVSLAFGPGLTIAGSLMRVL